MDSQKIVNVLLVDNDPNDALEISRVLETSEQTRFHITPIQHLYAIQTAMEHCSFDIMLLDFNLPDCSGISAISEAHAMAPELPIIVINNNAAEGESIAAVQAGAQDHLCKKTIEVKNAVKIIHHAMERNRMRSQLRSLHQQQQHLATHDTLTGLPNRQLLHDRLEQAFAWSERHKNNFALLFLDLDEFKTINDTLGHDCGDAVLKEVTKRLLDCVRKTDTLARVGGDEFNVLLAEIAQPEDAAHAAQRMLEALEPPITVNQQELYVTTSIGIAIYPNDGEDVKSILKNADLSMYSVKDNGKNNYKFFTADLNMASYQRLTFINGLRSAIEKDEFTLVYQPIENVRTQQSFCIEALLRWNHPDLGLLVPDQFINIAEESGVIVTIDEWVLNHACTQFGLWHQQGLGPERFAINVSARLFERREFASNLFALLDKANLPTERLQLEIKEGTILHNPDQIIASLKKLRARDINITIDDFGTGYSCLGNLKLLPIDALKIDCTFIESITENHEDIKLIKAIVALARSLDKSVIAEGVEREDQKQLLLELGCDNMQGYAICKPLPAAECESFIRNLKSQH